MNKQIESLIIEYFPKDKTAAEQFLSVYSNYLISEFEKYAETQYRKYKMSSNQTVKNDPWVLGTSEGADECVNIIKKVLD